MWDSVKKDYIAFLLSHNDRYSFRALFAIPTLSFDLKNLFLVYSSSVFDLFRFPSSFTTSGTVLVNGLLNLPFMHIKSLSTEFELPNRPGEKRKVRLDYIVIDQLFFVDKGVKITGTDLREKNTPYKSVLDMIKSFSTTSYPKPALPPIIEKIGEDNYIIYPLVSYSYEYSPKSIASKENELFSFPNVNIPSLLATGLLLKAGGEFVSDLVRTFVTPLVSGIGFQDFIAPIKCTIEGIAEKVPVDEIVAKLFSVDISSIPSPELLHNLKFGKIWGGADYPSARASANATIIGFIAINVNKMLSHPVFHSLSISRYLSENDVVALLNDGVIKLLGEVIRDKKRYIDISKRAIFRYVILPKFLTEYLKVNAARFAVVFRGENAELVHLQSISGFRWSFDGTEFNGFPINYRISLEGSDMSYGAIREIEGINESWLRVVGRSIAESVYNVLGMESKNESENVGKKFLDSIWFDGINNDLMRPIVEGTIDISDLFESVEEQ